MAVMFAENFELYSTPGDAGSWVRELFLRDRAAYPVWIGCDFGKLPYVSFEAEWTIRLEDALTFRRATIGILADACGWIGRAVPDDVQ